MSDVVSAEPSAEVTFPGYYTVAGYKGIAFYVTGYETVTREIDAFWIDEDGDVEQVGTGEFETVELSDGKLKMVMVGDDREHLVDREDITPLPDEQFCGGCGQVGCCWG